jgi:glucokinase
MDRIFLGIDLGGTFIKYGAINDAGVILRGETKPTAKFLGTLRDQIVGIVQDYQETFEIKAAGIGIAGFIRKSDSCIVKSPNMPFLNGVCFRDIVREKIRLPIFLENDANLSAWGEYLNLKDPRPDSFVHVTLGTGLGGGIILDGKIWRGEGGFAGELGHVVVNPRGRGCGCGSRGCVETESTATGIIRGYWELTAIKMDSALDIFKKAQGGDGNAIKCFHRAGYYLGIFLTTVINILNPAVISIGGGVARAGNILFEPAMAELKGRVNSDFLSGTEIKIQGDG